jgi:uncharacterized protein
MKNLIVLVFLYSITFSNSDCFYLDSADLFNSSLNAVSDNANLITDSIEITLSKQIKSILDKSKLDIRIITIEKAKSLKEHFENNFLLYGTTFYNCLPIDSAGMLIIVSKNDRKVNICNGYKTEKNFADSTCGRMLDQFMIPYLKKNNYDSGLQEIIKGINKYIIDKGIFYERDVRRK